MVAKYLLDSNILSEPMKRRPNPALLEKLAQHADSIVTASVVWHELCFGMERMPASRRRDFIERYLMDHVAVSMPILPYDQAAARWHSKIRAQLTTAGLTPPFRDGQIAATAKVHGLTLVTANVSDFQNIPDLTVVNWMA